MASKKVHFLEQSTRVHSAESTLYAGSTSNLRTNVKPSTVHLGPRTNEPDTEINSNPSTRLLDQSYPRYSAIGIPADGQSTDPEESEQRVVEIFINRCNTFLEWYRDSVIEFRNSFSMHVVHLLFAHIPISAIILGWLFNRTCPHTPILPTFMTVVGAVSVVFMGIWIAVSCCEHSGTPCSNRQKLAVGMLSMPILICMVIEMFLVAHLSPNFDPTAEYYCSKMFYSFVICKEVVSAAAIIIAALLYFPGSGLHCCWPNCSFLSRGRAFYIRV